jgi:hypothetical protein
MNHPTLGRRVAPSLIGPSLVLALGSAAGVCLSLAAGNGRALLVALALASLAVVGIVWQARALAAWRLRAALDVYAERDIARTKRASQNGPGRVRARAVEGRVPPRTAAAHPSIPRKGDAR